MRHVIRTGGTHPVDAIVETTDAAVRLTLEFHDDVKVAVPLTPAQAIRLSTAIYDAAWPLVEAKRGEGT